MDRLSQLRGEAGGSGDSTLDTTSPPSEAFMSANENSSKYFSINDSTFDITPIKDVSLASTSADADRSLSDGDELISNLSPIGKKELDSFKIGEQIEAANILSGGVDIFDGNDNSFDGDELVIDDNMETEDKANDPAEVALVEEVPEEVPEPDPEPAFVEPEANAANREMEVVLQIDGNNVNAIDIGNGLYLYRKDGQDELAAIQINDDDPQHSFKFLKVRDNAEGNLEVYEEIEIEVPREVPTKEGKLIDKNTPQVPTVDINKPMGECSTANSKVEGKNKSPQNEPIASTSTCEKIVDDKETSPESKTEVSWNGKMKFNESRKSPVVGSFTPMTFHSTPNKEGKPLTKTMVDLQLDPNRHSDNVKKTIEVHTENVKQKTTEVPVKEKEMVDNGMPVQVIPPEKETAEKSIEVTSKEQVEKDSHKDDDQNQTEAVKPSVSCGQTQKPEMNTNKETGALVKELVVEDLTKISVPSNNSKESTISEIKSAKTDVSVIEKEIINNTSKDTNIVVPNPDKPASPPTTIPEDKAGTGETSDTKEVPETTSKPVVTVIEKCTSVDSDLHEKQVINASEVAEKERKQSSENENDLAGSTVKAAMPVVVKKIENTADNKKGIDIIKPSKIKILENISLKFPTKTPSTDKLSALQVKSLKSESSVKSDDNVIKFPLESFSEVSSTCTTLGSDESKEERITLYSIDTDESVSLITPSSTTKIRDDKVVLSDNISEVLTTINNLSNIQTVNSTVNIDKTVLPLLKASTVSAEAKNEADSTSKIEQASCSKLEKLKSSDTTNSQKNPKEIKGQNIPALETKLSEKSTSFIPESKVKDSKKSALCNLVSNENLAIIGHPSVVESKPSVKETKHLLAPETKPNKVSVSEIKPPEKVSVSEIKLLNKIPQVIPASQVNTMGKPEKSIVSLDVKSVLPALKVESKSVDKAGFPPVVNPAEKKYSVPPSAKVINTTSISAKIKQSEISSTSSNKAVKPDSHIPVMSVANKPSSKLTPIIAPKVESATIKPTNNTGSQKDQAKINILEKKPIAARSEAREIKEPIRKSNVVPKPVNNNHTAAVPFGKWTDAHRQEFVNKFKEVKAPLSTNSKQIKNSNDLNRRDVLQKIDSQRAQTISNATAKGQEKTSVKSEAVFSSKVVSPTVESKPLPYSELAVNKLKQVSNKVIPKQENISKPVASTLAMNYATDVNAKMPGKTKPLPTSLTTVSKIESAPIEQSILKTESVNQDQNKALHASAVGKTGAAPKEQSTVAKSENAPKDQNTASCYMASLIDKTIEDMINKVVPGKNPDESKQALAINPSEQDSHAHKPVPEQVSKPIIDDSVSLDDIEMKMNELHGIPFVERPPHELPKILKSDIKTYSKTDKTKHLSKVSKITNITCEPILIKDLDSDEEIIEHEPITGDLDLKKKSVPVKITSEEKKYISEKNRSAIDKHTPNKDSEIITETEFDKFARRNSITYESCLTVNFDRKEPQNVQTIKAKDLPSKDNPKLESIRNDVKSKLPIQMMQHNFQTDKSQGSVNSSVPSDSSNKKYQSKIHNAYQSALTAKHQVSRPISIIEDKPVKVVFLESSIGFVPSQLNVQGQELSPAKKPETDAANNDSVDSGMLELMYDNKQQDKTKIKHQRKQVLTPVEEPDLELIQPSDIGIEITSKKKRKAEDIQSKNLVPKKSYLLGRNTTTEDKIPNNQVSVKDTKNVITRNEDVPEHKDAASAIDNLVKAAELLDNQTENINKSVSSDSAVQVNSPVKRGRGRPRKYPLPDGAVDGKSPSPQKKPRLIDAKPIKQDSISDDQDDDSSDEAIVRENWTMGKINENIVCPICNKLFRSENVVFKHVKHCTGVSPNRSESDKKSPRRSRLSQESEDMDYELSSSESKKDTPKKLKSKESAKSEATPDKKKLDIGKDDVIVIEDTPIKEKSKTSNEEKEEEPKKEAKAKVLHRNKNLTCEFCGKMFRQQSYLMSHKLQHKKDLPKKKEQDIQDSNKLRVFSCEICKKEFRKLHHLVQHRINHNPDSGPKRALRKSSEQNEAKNLKEDVVAKQIEDASAGFRCEPCDKSFRKLHHLVEHRGTHDGINRQKPSAPVQSTVEQPPPPPQCEICKKTFRKLHHLIEHKEQHAETSSDKSDEKSGKSALSTKDIIHECSLCYMVFPNEHSLNKHSAHCSKKKRQSKQLKDTIDIDSATDDENLIKEKKEDDIDAETPQTAADDVAKEQNNEEVEKLPLIENVVKVETPVVMEETQIENAKITLNEVLDKPSSKEDAKSTALLSTPVKRDITKSDANKEKEQPVVPEKIKKVDVKEIKTQDVPKKKTVQKDKGTPHVTKRQKSVDAALPVAEVTKPSVESSDDDEVRYMLNPDFKVEDTSDGKTFLKVRAGKRNSLQIERPNSNDHAKRRTSLQLPPKVSRLKPKTAETKSKAADTKPKVQESSTKSMETKSKATENKTATSAPPKLKQVPKSSKAEEVLSTDSDDSDVKYSFPKTAPETSKPERASKEIEKKIPRKSLAEKRKTVSGIAKRKSLGKAITAKHKASTPPPPKPIKRRTLGVELRCDCGELFSSAALLARHAILAHTPPRIRRARASPAPQPVKQKPARKSTNKTETPPAKPTPTRKSSLKKTEPETRQSLKPEAKSAPKTRRSAHSGVPIPEKMRKLMNNSK